VHPATDPIDGGRCAPLDSTLRGSLQHDTTAQRHRLCDPAGSARRTAGRDPRGSRSQVRTGSRPATTSPAADAVFEVCTLFHLSYNDLAGRNGSRHCRDATMLRDNLVGLIEPMLSSAGANPLALRTATKKPSDDRPPCLENPRPEGAELTLTENAPPPFHAEPKQFFVSSPQSLSAPRN
jgi:hypothetical protein